jgi:hypothetical protein
VKGALGIIGLSDMTNLTDKDKEKEQLAKSRL